MPAEITVAAGQTARTTAALSRSCERLGGAMPSGAMAITPPRTSPGSAARASARGTSPGCAAAGRVAVQADLDQAVDHPPGPAGGPPERADQP